MRSAVLTFVLAVVASLPSERLAAQGAVSVAFEATVGGGNGRGGEFRDRGIAGARLALSLRAPLERSVALYGEIAMEWLALGMGHDASCIFSSRGGCLQPFPELAGPSAVFGIMARPRRRWEFRAGLGVAAYGADGTRVGGVTGQLDAALFPFQRVGMVVGVRPMVVPRFRGDQLSILPFAVGLRVR